MRRLRILDPRGLVEALLRLFRRRPGRLLPEDHPWRRIARPPGPPRRVPVSPADTRFIAERIRCFPEEAPPASRWELPFVREFGALPLYFGWTETLGIRPDGTLVRWSAEHQYDGVRSIDLSLEANLALVECASRYPNSRILCHPGPAERKPARTATAPAVVRWRKQESPATAAASAGSRASRSDDR